MSKCIGFKPQEIMTKHEWHTLYLVSQYNCIYTWGQMPLSGANISLHLRHQDRNAAVWIPCEYLIGRVVIQSLLYACFSETHNMEPHRKTILRCHPFVSVMYASRKWALSTRAIKMQRLNVYSRQNIHLVAVAIFVFRPYCLDTIEAPLAMELFCLYHINCKFLRFSIL